MMTLDDELLRGLIIGTKVSGAVLVLAVLNPFLKAVGLLLGGVCLLYAVFKILAAALRVEHATLDKMWRGNTQWMHEIRQEETKKVNVGDAASRIFLIGITLMLVTYL